MYKKFILSLLSFVSLATVVQAGHLELTADLSEEQKTAINKKFVEPYQEEYAGGYFDAVLKKGWEESVVGQYRPYISPLKEMSFNTTLVSNIQLKEANMIAKTYINIANNSDENKVSTTPYLNGNESIGRIVKKEKIANRLRLMPENPSLEDLKNLQVRDLGVFCKGDQLFCKTYDQDALEIMQSDDDLRKGIPSESFKGILKAIKENDEMVDLMYGGLLRQYTSKKDFYTIRNNERVHIKNYVATNPAIFKTWNEKIISEFGSEVESLQHKINSSGSIYFSETSMETEGENGLLENCRWTCKKREMEKKIGKATFETTDLLTLQFNSFKLTYIPYGDEGDVGFTIPFTLGDVL